TTTHVVRFKIEPGSPVIGSSLNEIEVDYGSTDVTDLVDACGDAPNAEAGTSPPCPSLVQGGIDGPDDDEVTATPDTKIGTVRLRVKVW
ncbi:MAG: hypothetical protein SV760_03745, partial [Halobacteria archaeon]|nr:hypothetical protein [Halobacteria archaeon]